MKNVFGTFLWAMLLLSLAWGELSGFDVMKKADSRYTGDDGVSRIAMSIVNSRKQERNREIVLWRKKVDKVNDISHTFILFLTPADVKDTTFLILEKGNGADDDQWIYLPAMRKVRKISSSEKDKSFMGTDFSYDDMSNRDIDSYEWTLVKREEWKGEMCYVVKGVRKDKDKAVYDHSLFWVREKDWIPVKALMFDKKQPERISKVMLVNELKEIQGIMTPLETVMYTVKPIYKEGRDLEKSFQSKTVLRVKEVRYNVGLDSSIFSQRNMERPMPYQRYLD
ncbi:outer membrane lipoprotein-sorting protein [Candidatus Mcinerneyibacteriota bacterium]|nr:outer membrane lipoprotein-sorting protein [Candidatus Mcinerneyibacteriota bacterium]HDS03071.1 outer membrane lipoprotein-sorting protein [Bacillota bacterium]